MLLVIGLIAFPLVSRVCGRLLDKGYSISKNPKGRVPLDRLPSYLTRFAFLRRGGKTNFLLSENEIIAIGKTMIAPAIKLPTP